MVAAQQLFNMSGPVSLIFSFMGLVELFKIQQVNKRTYTITLPPVIKTVSISNTKSQPVFMLMG